jgi:acyl-CoA thioester hydrolase
MSKRPSAPLLNSFSLCMERRLDWSELDTLGHANNARYFTWFEEARMAYFQATGIPTVNGKSWGPILAHTDCHFLAPVTWPAVLLLGAQVNRIGNSSLQMRYGVFIKHPDQNQTPPTCVAHGSGVVVLVNYESGEKVQVSETLRAAIEILESTSSSSSL